MTLKIDVYLILSLKKINDLEALVILSHANRNYKYEIFPFCNTIKLLTAGIK